jgi:undecaprenyl-diphosphatase
VATALFAAGRRREAYLLALGLAISIATVAAFKLAFFRPRPFAPSATASGELVGEAASSFPSGHTARAFSAATVLGRRFLRGKILLWSAAFIAGFSRVYLGYHWPTDVVAGAFLGWLSGLAALRLEGFFRGRGVRF